MNVSRDFGPSTQPTVSELDRDLLHGGARVGGCVIIEALSQDDGGIVYVADDPVLRRRVLIREHYPLGLAARGPKGEVVLVSGTRADVRASALEAFLRGARLLDSFDHPSIARVHRVWEEQGTAYLMSPFHEGSPLGAHLHRQTQPPDEAWLRGLLVPLLGALEALHAAGVFHLGLSPESIWLTGDERPVLIDLSSSVESAGAARAAADSVDRQYAPIELFSHGTGFPVGPWTDLYGIAAVLHQALLGRPPMSAAVLGPADEHAPLAEGLLRRVGARASSLPSASFLRAIDQALSVRPEHRPQSVAAFRQLMGLAEELPHVVMAQASAEGADTPGPLAAAEVAPVAAPAPVSPSAAAVRPEPPVLRDSQAFMSPPRKAPEPMPPTPLDSEPEPEIDEAASAAIALAMSSLTWTDRREPVLPGSAPRPTPQPQVKPAAAGAASRASRSTAPSTAPLPGRSGQREPGFGSAGAAAGAKAGPVPSWVMPGPGKRRKGLAPKTSPTRRRVQVLAGLLIGFATLSVAGWYAKDSPQVMAWVQPWLNEVGLRPAGPEPAVVAESPTREASPAAAATSAAPAEPAALLAQEPTAAGAESAAASAAGTPASLSPPAPVAAVPTPPAAAEPVVAPTPRPLTAKERAAARAADRAAVRAAERSRAAERAAVRTAERDAARAKAAERTAARAAEREAARAKAAESARATAEAVPATPRAACGTRSNFALFRCMETQCNLGRYSRHPQCIQFRADGDV